MAKTLANSSDVEELRRRIAGLTPDSHRLWGKMSVGGMICHLDDSYRAGLGERTVAPASAPFLLPRTLIKRLALHSSLRWARNMKSPQEVRQGAGGTPPVAFTDDQVRLLETLNRFTLNPDLDKMEHPFFGKMTANDWLRWGYLHADHHLRQFSA
jgi:Protein of unknown function (DUF1569)